MTFINMSELYSGRKRSAYMDAISLIHGVAFDEVASSVLIGVCEKKGLHSVNTSRQYNFRYGFD